MLKNPLGYSHKPLVCQECGKTTHFYVINDYPDKARIGICKKCYDSMLKRGVILVSYNPRFNRNKDGSLKEVE